MRPAVVALASVAAVAAATAVAAAVAAVATVAAVAAAVAAVALFLLLLLLLPDAIQRDFTAISIMVFAITEKLLRYFVLQSTLSYLSLQAMSDEDGVFSA